MAFNSTFGRVFSPTFNPKSMVSGASQWWLSGGIAAANCVAAYQPKGAVSYVASLTDLSGTGNDATAGAAPDWDATNGWKFNGVSHYLNTGVSVNGGGFSVFIRYNKFSNSNGRLFGTSPGDNTDPRCAIVPARSILDQGLYYNGNGPGTITPGSIAAISGVAGNKMYINGVDKLVTLPAWSGTNTNAVWIGCQNNNGTPATYGMFYCQAFVMYNTQITAPQAAALYTAMAAL